MSDGLPIVSIGLPVYNGEAYLEEAIDSVLGQTFSDFVLIISDNASDDRTYEICQSYAKADSRVRYLRNTENIGAARNYDRVWHESSTKYFKWLAHDDRILPDYLAKTIEVLEGDESIILCNSIVDYIDEHGSHLGYYESVIKHATGEYPADRLAALVLRMHTCVDFFGVIRREKMVGSLLHQAYRGSDRAFLAQMAIRGRFFQIPEPLVQMRQHPAQYSRMKNVRQQLAWQDPDRKSSQEIAVLRLFRVYRDLVSSEAMSEKDRRACRGVLRRFWFQSWPLPRLFAELLSVPFPKASSLFRSIAIKLRLSGAPEDFVN